jgi:catechol 2,3-dioxygenase-like lactoylglutathione lyase family enzyme
MPNVSGLLESSLYVEDLERSAEFYQRLFQFKALTSDARLCALNVAGQQVLLLFQKGATTQPVETGRGVIPGHDGSGDLHLAFSIADSELDGWRDWLKENGVAVESEVSWLRGGRSLYFRDPDRNLVEVLTRGTWSIY